MPSDYFGIRFTHHILMGEIPVQLSFVEDMIIQMKHISDFKQVIHIKQAQNNFENNCKIIQNQPWLTSQR